MTCPHCGADAPDGKKFCPACYRLVDSPLLKMKQDLDVIRLQYSALRLPTLTQRMAQNRVPGQPLQGAHDLQHHIDIGAETFARPTFPEHPTHAVPSPTQTPANQLETRKERMRRKQRERQAEAAGASHSTAGHRFEPSGHGAQPTAGQGAKAEAPAGAVPERFKRPAALTVYAVLDLIAAVALIRIAAGLHEAYPEPRIPLITYGIYALGGLAAVCALAALGMWNMWSIGRTLQRLLVLPFMLAPPLGTGYAIFTLLYLARPAMKLLFSGRSPRQLNAKEWKDVQASLKLSPLIAILLFIFAWAPALAAARFAVESLPRLLEMASQTFPQLGTLPSAGAAGADANTATGVEEADPALVAVPEQAALLDVAAMMRGQAVYAGLNAGLYDRVECVVAPQHCIRNDDGRNSAKLLAPRFTQMVRNGYVFQLRLNDAPASRPETASATGMGGYAYRAFPVSGKGTGFCGDHTGTVCTFDAEHVGGDPLRCPNACTPIPLPALP